MQKLDYNNFLDMADIGKLLSFQILQIRGSTWTWAHGSYSYEVPGLKSWAYFIFTHEIVITKNLILAYIS